MSMLLSVHRTVIDEESSCQTVLWNRTRHFLRKRRASEGERGSGEKMLLRGIENRDRDRDRDRGIFAVPCRCVG